MISVIPRKTIIMGLQFGKLWCWKPTTLPWKLSIAVFFCFVLFCFDFFENRLKSNFWWIAQKRFSKKVKQVLQRRRGEGRSCNRTAKENKMNYYENSYCRHFHDILSEFCLNGVFMNGFQLLWLLRSRKVVGYKIDIPIPDPWI